MIAKTLKVKKLTWNSKHDSASEKTLKIQVELLIGKCILSNKC